MEDLISVSEAEAFKSQTQDYDESRRFGAGSLKDRKERPEEGDMEISRPGPDETITRKASEHKSPYEAGADSIADMENTAWPEWDQTPYNWFNYGGYPGYEYYPPVKDGYAGWGPISRYNEEQPYPDEAAEILLYLKGCKLSGSSIIRDCTKTYKYHFFFLAGNVVKIDVEGPAELISPVLKDPGNIPKSLEGSIVMKEGTAYLAPGLSKEQAYYANKWVLEHRYYELDKYPPDIIIKPYENAEYGSIITIRVYTKLIKNDMLFDGWCEKKVELSCGCRDVIPDIYATGDAVTMGPSESLNMWVNSLNFPDLYAVPPFAWSLSGGVGFSLSKTETNDEYEVNVLSTDAAPSGTATVTVTDNCGISDTYDVAEGCVCAGAPPTPEVVSGVTSMGQSASLNLRVSAPNACPPFTWSVTSISGGWALSKAQTTENLEVNTLTTGPADCGVARIWVTDACGVQDSSLYIHNTVGKWVDYGNPFCPPCVASQIDHTRVSYTGVHKYVVGFDTFGGVHGDPCMWSSGDSNYNCDDDCCTNEIINNPIFSGISAGNGCYRLTGSSPSGSCENVFPSISSWAINVSDIHDWQWQCP
uniref:Uncharacterized protein n=1 Tax=viral metagenome TaxID=1070528 RepID=A0A6M3KSE1_9ZZZZ